jgi:thiaminase/transcriptional activator TenA
MTESLSRRLWTANQDLARACLDHPFVRGLGNGTLARSAFQSYIAQDAYFLEAFARTYAFALAHAPDREGLHEFSDLIQGVLQELKLHGGYARAWQVDLPRVAPGQATRDYTGFLQDIARRGNVGETCAAMTPCMRLYAFLGQSLAGEQAGGHAYSDWIRTYASAEFERLAVRLEALLNRYGEESDLVRSLYRRALELELGFFTAHG